MENVKKDRADHEASQVALKYLAITLWDSGSKSSSGTIRASSSDVLAVISRVSATRGGNESEREMRMHNPKRFP